MAAVPEGSNPGRIGHAARQSPGRTRHGRSEAGVDPTNENGQTPGEIFGFSQTYSTGAGGSAGAATATSDVTIERGQLDAGLANVEGSEITSTGAPGSEGARNSAGGEHVTYTDPYALMGGVFREVSTSGRISGEGDWTQANDMGYAGGPTLPSLVNNRPTSSGAGKGHVRGAGKGL